MKVITFDFWNTLFLDLDEGVRNNKRISFTWDLLSTYDPDLAGELVEEAFHHASEHFNKQWSTLTASTMAQYVENVCKRLRITVKEEDRQRLVDFYETILLEHPPGLIEGAAEAIQTAASRNLKIGLISDTGYSPGKTLRRVLAEHGLDRFFHCFSFSNETGYLKPSRQCYEKILEDLAIPPHEVVHVGDLEHTDILGAKEMGMKAIKYIGANSSSIYDSRADAVIEDWKQLPEILDRWM